MLQFLVLRLQIRGFCSSSLFCGSRSGACGSSSLFCGSRSGVCAPVPCFAAPDPGLAAPVPCFAAPDPGFLRQFLVLRLQIRGLQRLGRWEEVQLSENRISLHDAQLAHTQAPKQGNNRVFPSGLTAGDPQEALCPGGIERNRTGGFYVDGYSAFVERCRKIWRLGSATQTRMGKKRVVSLDSNIEKSKSDVFWKKVHLKPLNEACRG